MDIEIRRARTSDVPAISSLLRTYSGAGQLLQKATVTLYESVQEFRVAERVHDGAVIGCGALHVMWDDLAEVRSVAVTPDSKGLGVGGRLVGTLLDTARWIGIRRVFVLTFETSFFSRLGFKEIEGTPVDHDVWEELVRSYDDGVAEFLDLERVKPNTLGNTRMLLHL